MPEIYEPFITEVLKKVLKTKKKDFVSDMQGQVLLV